MEAAALNLPGLPTSKAGIILRAKRERWPSRPRQARGGGLEYDPAAWPAEAQVALALQQPGLVAVGSGAPANDASPADSDLAWQHFDRKPEAIKANARARLQALHDCDLAIKLGAKKRAAMKAVAEKHQTAWQNIDRWYDLVKGLPRSDWLPALAPKYAGRTATEIEPEAWELFKADYFRPERPALAACYERLSRIAAARGWRLPSIATFKRKAEREIAPTTRTLMRFGPEALKASVIPAQRRDRSMFRPLEAVCADAHEFDVKLRWPDGSIDRPAALAWVDLATNRVLAWRIGRNPCSELVRLSYGDMVEQHGVPDEAYLDNGREFASKWMSGGMKHRYRFKVKPDEPLGVFTLMGTKVTWVTVAHGQAKPIERGFGVWAEYISKAPDLAGAYTGRNPLDKPHNYDAKPAKLEDFVRVVAREIAALNARTSRARHIAGKSPDEAWVEKLPSTPIRKATANQRALWLLAAEGVTARQPDGAIHFAENRYWGECLRAHVGKKLVIRFDPQRLHQPLFVYGLDGRLIGEAACIADTGFRDTNAAQEFQRLRNVAIRAARKKADAEIRLEALDVARALEPPPGAPAMPALVEAKVLRPATFAKAELPVATDSPKRKEVARLVEGADALVERLYEETMKRSA